MKIKKKIIISIIIVICLGTVGIVGYSLMKNQEDKEVNRKEEKEEQENNTIDEETKKAISTKITQLANSGFVVENTDYTPKDDEYFSLLWLFLEDLFTKEGLTEEQKNYIALNSIKSKPVKINLDDVKDNTIKERLKQIDSDGNILQISKEEAEIKYREFFGSEMSHQNIDGCPAYLYDEYNKVYYNVGECGGTSATTGYFHKSNYQKEKNTITVEVTVAYLVNLESLIPNEENVIEDQGKISIYKDNPKYEDLINNTVSAVTQIELKENYEIEDIENSFKINDTNKKDFNTYKFTFKEDKNGKYYFKSISKITE